MAEQHDVRIVSWPQEQVRVSHQFEEGQPAPVTVSFDKTPLNAVLSTDPERRLAVDMNMNLRALEAIPICIKLCEALCAESEYVIGITLFDRPIISITIRGTTKLANCKDEYE